MIMIMIMIIIMIMIMIIIIILDTASFICEGEKLLFSKEDLESLFTIRKFEFQQIYGGIIRVSYSSDL